MCRCSRERRCNVKRKTLRPLIGLFVAFTLVSCSDSSLTKLSKALDDVTIGIGGLEKTVIASNQAGAISDADTQTILLLCQKINTAEQEASKTARALVKLNATGSSSILATLGPVTVALNDVVVNGLAGIKDPATKTKITDVLVTVQTALTTAEAILVATGGK